MGIARLERNMASAEEDHATLRYDRRRREALIHRRVPRNAEYTGWLPGQAGEAARDLRARQPRRYRILVLQR
jgi:hypothetical protein